MNRIVLCFLIGLCSLSLGAQSGQSLSPGPATARPAAEGRPEIFVQKGHSGQVYAVAFSPDGRYALSGSGDATMKLWEVSTGREIRTFSGHTGQIAAVTISPDGRYALSGSGDATVKLWELSSGREIRTFQGHPYGVRSVAFSPDGRLALSGGGDEVVRLWDVSSGKEIRAFHGHTSRYQVESVAFSPDGRYALSGCGDMTMKLWEVSSGRELRTFQGHTSSVRSVAFSPDGKYALSGSGDYTMKLWEVASGRVVRTFKGHTNQIFSVAFSPDGKVALSGGMEGTVKLWKISTGKVMKSFPGHIGYVWSVAFSPDGRYALSESDYTMKLWDLASGRETRLFQGHTFWVQAVAFSPDGRYALSGSGDSRMRLWDLSGGSAMKTLLGAYQVNALAFSPDGRSVLAASGVDKLKLWDVSSGMELKEFQGHTSWIRSVSFSPDGRYALSGSEDKTMKLWDVSSGRELKTQQEPKTVDAVAFSPDGRLALFGTAGTLKLWDVSSGQVIRAFKGHTAGIYSVAFSPDGRYALSGSEDMTMKLWDISSGQELRTFQGHTNSVRSVAFSPDGRRALSGSWDDTLKLWEVSSGREIETMHEAYPVNGVAFSPDARYALSGSQSGTTTLWDAASGKAVAQMVGFTDDEWVVITPEGYFTSSPNGAKHLNVRIGNSVYGVDQFYAKFYRPELVQLALAGKELPKGESLGDVLATKNAPTVRIMSPASGTTVDKDSVTLQLKITDNGGGLGSVNIYLNGSQVMNDTRGVVVKGRPSTTEQSISFTISLLDGPNEIKAIAFNKEGSMESIPAAITVTAKAGLAKPSLYALVVGINEYRNKSISLTYAVPDAKAFAETLANAAGPLFGKVDVELLTTPAGTSKDAISKAFEDLRPKIKPNDLFVFYDASHGMVDTVDNDEQYFLITSNVLFLSSDHISMDALSQKDLARLLGNIPAQKKIVILDTCNAGKAGKGIQLALLQQTRGLTEATAIKILQRAVGSATFMASSDTQEALEGYQGHGLFTYVLMEGLKGKADFKRDGIITVTGLKLYAEEEVVTLSEQVFKHQQIPMINPGDTDFPIGKVR